MKDLQHDFPNMREGGVNGRLELFVGAARPLCKTVVLSFNRRQEEGVL